MAASTLVKGDLSAIKMILESLHIGEEALEVLHLFDVEKLDNYLSQTGFKSFAYNIYGAFILFYSDKG